LAIELANLRHRVTRRIAVTSGRSHLLLQRAELFDERRRGRLLLGHDPIERRTLIGRDLQRIREPGSIAGGTAATARTAAALSPLSVAAVGGRRLTSAALISGDQSRREHDGDRRRTRRFQY